MQNCDASIVVDVRECAGMWAIYEHQVVLEAGKPPEVVFVGCCRLIDIYRLRDPRSNNEWQKLFSNGGSVLVRIIATSTNRKQAMKFAIEHRRSLRPQPRCNALGYNARSVRRAIICEETGQKFASQKMAADAMGLSQSSLCRHLAGELLHAGGYSFYYASE